jgi:hypothetical protein
MLEVVHPLVATLASLACEAFHVKQSAGKA